MGARPRSLRKRWRRSSLCLQMNRIRSHPRFWPRGPTRKPGKSALARNATWSGEWRGKPLMKTRGARRDRWTTCPNAAADDPEIPAPFLGAVLRYTRASKIRSRVIAPSPQWQKPGTWAAGPIQREDCSGVQFRRTFGDGSDQPFAT